jgi:hypothetical protein
VFSPFSFALNLGASSAATDTAFVRFLNAGIGETTGTVRIIATNVTPIIVGTTRIAYFGNNGQLMCARVTANLGGGDFTIVPEDVATFNGFNGGGYDAVNNWFAIIVSNGVMASGLTWTASITRETRTVLCNGAVNAGAMSLPCKAQANIATRDWTAADAITMNRDFACTVDITAAGSIVDQFEYDIDLEMDVFVGKSHSITFNAATSTFDEVDPSDRPNPLFLGEWRFVSIVGNTINLFKAPSDPGLSNPMPTGVLNLAWTLSDTYALTGTASWGTNGRVTLTLASAIPAGRSYARGLPVGSSWISGFLRLHAAVSGGANTVELFGHDAFFSNTAPSSPSRGALYRVTASGSTMPIPGDTLYAQGTVTADALGEALVPLQAANVNVIADGAPITITRPQLVASTEPQTGSVLRLFCQVGGVTGEPSSSTPGWGHELARFNVPVGSTRQITALSVFGLSVFDWMAPQGPVVAIVDSAGNILGWSALGEDGALIEVAPGVVALQTRAVIATGGQYTVRVYGGSPTSYTRWCVHVRTLLFQGEADDVPYTRESYAALLQLTGTRALVEGARPRVTDTVTVTEFLALHAQALGVSPTLLPRITLGGLVHIEDVDRIARVTAMTRRSGTSDSEIELGTVGPDGGRLLGATALAAGTRRPR